MPFDLPLFLEIPRRALVRRDAIPRLVGYAGWASRTDVVFAIEAFAFKNDELSFARALLDRRTQLRLFRSNQRAFCGDFVVVDVSSPAVARRRAVVIDLKQGAALKLGGGGAGAQLRHADRIVRAIAATRTVSPDAPYDLVTGDGAQVIRFLSEVRGVWGRLRPHREGVPKPERSRCPT